MSASSNNYDLSTYSEKLRNTIVMQWLYLCFDQVTYQLLGMEQMRADATLHVSGYSTISFFVVRICYFFVEF